MELVTLTLSLAFAFAMLALSIVLVAWSLRETFGTRTPRTPRDTVRHSRTHAHRASLNAQDTRAHNTRTTRKADELTRAMSGALAIAWATVEDSDLRAMVFNALHEQHTRATALGEDALAMWTDYALTWSEDI